jgi:DNA-binding FrmR family transcriptional regulator
LERKKSYVEDKDTILLRLRQMEGQVCGMRQMVQDDRYCLDVVRQINALSAAARGVALLVLENHLRGRGCITEAVQQNEGEAAIRVLITVLGKALRQ